MGLFATEVHGSAHKNEGVVRRTQSRALLRLRGGPAPRRVARLPPPGKPSNTRAAGTTILRWCRGACLTVSLTTW